METRHERAAIKCKLQLLCLCGASFRSRPKRNKWGSPKCSQIFSFKGNCGDKGPSSHLGPIDMSNEFYQKSHQICTINRGRAKWSAGRQCAREGLADSSTKRSTTVLCWRFWLNDPRKYLSPPSRPKYGLRCLKPWPWTPALSPIRSLQI